MSTSEVSLEDKKKFICANTKNVNREDRVEIGIAFVRSGLKSHLKESSDGCRINLNNIPEQSINNVYNILQHKLNKK